MAIHIELSVSSKNLSTGPLQRTLEFLNKIKKVQDEVNSRFRVMADNLGSVADAANRALPMQVRSNAGRGGQSNSQRGETKAGSSSDRGKATPMDVFKLFDRLNKVSGGKYEAQRTDALRNAVKFAQQQMNLGQGAGFRNMHWLMNFLSPQGGDSGDGSVPSRQGRGSQGRVKKPPIIKPPKSTAQLFHEMISTSRFGSGGLMPLVGKTASFVASALGLSKFAGIIGNAATIIAMGTAMFADQFMVAANYLRRRTDSTSLLGSDASRAGFGLSGGSLDAASRIRQAISSGGMGAAYGISAGVSTNLGPKGVNDYGKMVRDVRVKLANMESFDAARRMAEALNIPEAASSYYLSKRQKRELGQFKTMSPQEMQRGAQLTFELDATSKAFEDLRLQAMQPFMDLLIESGPAIRNVADFYANYYRNLSKAAVGVFELTGIGAALKVVNAAMNGGDEKGSTTRENTKAIKENTREMREGRQLKGGGSRAKNAIPGKIGGRNWTPGNAAALGVGGVY